MEARKQAEKDFFAEVLENIKDYSNSVFIKKGTINYDIIVNEIISLKPDLLVCYGSSVIKSKLVDYFKVDS